MVYTEKSHNEFVIISEIQDDFLRAKFDVHLL
jgi:hypothetical protein